jgi:predicted ABC-type ATPase
VAIQRIAQRVIKGGRWILAGIVGRRYHRSLRYFVHVYAARGKVVSVKL